MNDRSPILILLTNYLINAIHMTQHEMKVFLRQEIAKLNQKIDWKIASGYSYKDDARRHKALLTQVKRLNRRSTFRSWFYSMRSAMTLF